MNVTALLLVNLFMKGNLLIAGLLLKTVDVAALLLVNLFMKGGPADSWATVVGLLLGEEDRGRGCPALGQLVPCLVYCYQDRDRHWRLGAVGTWSSRTG